MTENHLKYYAFNYLIQHIYEYQEKLEKVTYETARREYAQRIEVYEYLLKLIGGEVKDESNISN